MTPPRLLCLWLPHWPIQRRTAARPDAKPLVLYGADARQRQQVAACSSAAARRGIRPGMPVAEVKSLAGDVQLEPHDPPADRASLERVAVWCERFSPLVGLEEAAEPESLLLDITGVVHLFGDEPSLAHRMHQDLRRRGYHARIAIADTPGAAWGLAHFADAAVGISISPPGSTAALAELPIEALRLPEETVATLRRLGVTLVEQLERLPRTSLPARFGPVLHQRLEQLTGEREELLVPHRPPPEFQAAWALEFPTDHRGTMEQVLLRLLEQVTRELARHDRGAMQLECLLHCAGAGPVVVEVGLFRPTAQPAHLMELVRMRLERLTLPAEVEKFLVAVVRSAPLVCRQHELFRDDCRDDPLQLAALVDRLSSRLGRDRVVRARLQAGAQPERSCRFVPLTGTGGAGSRRGKPSAPLAALHRPLRLLACPLPVETMCLAPDGPPAVFQHQQRQYTIHRHWGPERIETAWWRGTSVRRDYYRVECTDGRRFWLFRRLQDAQWFLHGTFD